MRASEGVPRRLRRSHAAATFGLIATLASAGAPAVLAGAAPPLPPSVFPSSSHAAAFAVGRSSSPGGGAAVARRWPSRPRAPTSRCPRGAPTTTITMGVLTYGRPLPWAEARPHLRYVREHGVLQFISTYDRVRDIRNDELLWGDELECVPRALRGPSFFPPSCGCWGR